MAPLHYGLNLGKKSTTSSVTKPAPAKRKALFDDDLDQDEDAASKPSSKSSSNVREIDTFDVSNTDRPTKSESTLPASTLKNKKPPPSLASGPLDLASRLSHSKHAAAAEALDPSIYDYDAAYDVQKAAEQKRKEVIQGETSQRGAKQMADLLAAAEVRKRDQTRAQDRLIQKEREAEGDEFKDKEAFVTDAYKAQQEETMRLQEEEKERAAREDKLRKSGKGMTNFYKNLMAEEEKKHEELMRGMEAVAQTGASLSHEEELDREKAQAERAKELRAQGREVILTEDGQVSDKRQLLNAGLNIVSKPKSKSADGSSSQQASAFSSPLANQSRKEAFGGGRGRDGQRAQRERQTRMIEAQLEQASKRAAEEEEEERLRVERAAKSRKTNADISSAKERYLQRKREAATIAAATAAGGSGGGE